MNYPLPQQSKKYFRSLGDLEQTPEFEDFLHREFPTAASEFPEGVSRRRWVQLMGASLAFGGAVGCRYNREEFAEFVVRPEGRVAGLPQYFASNFEWAGRAVHALVTCREGRPIKLDGNPEHPINQPSANKDFNDGKDKKFDKVGTDHFTQAAILSLYDPDRLGAVLLRDRQSGTVESQEANQLADWTALRRWHQPRLRLLRPTKAKA